MPKAWESSGVDGQGLGGTLHLGHFQVGSYRCRSLIEGNSPNIGASTTTEIILGVPNYSYSIMGPKTLF